MQVLYLEDVDAGEPCAVGLRSFLVHYHPSPLPLNRCFRRREWTHLFLLPFNLHSNAHIRKLRSQYTQNSSGATSFSFHELELYVYCLTLANRSLANPSLGGHQGVKVKTLRGQELNLGEKVVLQQANRRRGPRSISSASLNVQTLGTVQTKEIGRICISY